MKVCYVYYYVGGFRDCYEKMTYMHARSKGHLILTEDGRYYFNYHLNYWDTCRRVYKRYSKRVFDKRACYLKYDYICD